MATAPFKNRPVLVFLGGTKKIIDAIGNNNDWTPIIIGAAPISIELTADEIGWGARENVGDEHYADFLRLIMDITVTKEGISLDEWPDWRSDVRLVVFGIVSVGFNGEDQSVRNIFKTLFPNATFITSDSHANIVKKIWTRGRPRKPKSDDSANAGAASESSEPDDNPMLGYPLAELELGLRAYNKLRQEGIDTIGDLTNKSRAELEAIYGFGKRSIEETVNALDVHDLKLREPAETGIEHEAEEPPPDPVLSSPIEEWLQAEIYHGAYDCLKRVGINTIGDLIVRSRENLRVFVNMRPSFVDEVVEALQKRGLKLADE